MAEYIDRDVLLEKAISYFGCIPLVNDDIHLDDFLTQHIPKADVAPVKRGDWIEESSLYVYCPECRTMEHHREQNFKSKYCPECGADMRKE